MDKDRILYSITVEDVMDVAEEIGINFTEADLRIIEDKIGDFMGDKWNDAIEYALEELKKST